MSFGKRRKTCPFSGPRARKIDWKDPDTLRRFVSDTGRIIPTRITAVSPKMQRPLALAIKRARFMALIQYPNQED